MKYFLFLIVIFCFSCDKNKVVNNNLFLPNYTFSFDVNLNLPDYNNLEFAGNSVFINAPGVGVRGVFLFNTGSDYLAYDAACPNQQLSDCSTMTLSQISATCPCDSKKYSLYTGLSNGEKFPMKAYRIEILDKTIRIYN